MQTKPNIEQIMARIRSKVEQELANGAQTVPRFHAGGAQFQNGQSSSVLYSDELNYLNANWQNYNPAEDLSSHRFFIGPIIVRLKKSIINFFWNNLFKSHFAREQEFKMNLVRFLNSQTRYIDSRNAEIFWQLVEKIDNDTEALNERCDLLFDEAHARLQTFEETVNEVKKS